MSTTIEIKVPDIGNVHDVDVVAVEIQTGDVIAVDQTLITLETDKASMDVPSSAAGTVQQVHLKVGDKVNEGSLMVTVLVSDEAAAPAPVAEVAPAPAPVVEEVKAVEAEASAEVEAPVAKVETAAAAEAQAEETPADETQSPETEEKKGE